MEEENPPLPVLNLAIISLAQFAGAISLTSVFPYVGFMMVDLGMAKNIDEAGFYAGYVAAAMMMGRILTSIYWGKLADKIGRKPVLCISCFSVSIFTLIFGFVTNFYAAVFVRLLLGMFNPIIGLAKTVISEVCPKKHEYIGMGTITGSWGLGLILGSAIGGILARPAQVYPQVFGHIRLLRTYPYLLPNLFCSAIGVISLVLICMFFPETLKSRVAARGDATNVQPAASKSDKVAILVRDPKQPEFSIVGEDDNDNDSENENEDDENDENDENAKGESKDDLVVRNLSDKSSSQVRQSARATAPAPASSKSKNPTSSAGQKPDGKTLSIVEMLQTPKIFNSIIGYVLLSVLSIALDDVLPLWLMSSVPRGGYGYTMHDVGIVMSSSGIALIFFSVILYPWMSKKIDSPAAFFLGTLLTTPLVILLSFTSQILRLDQQSQTLFVAVSSIYSLVKMSENLSFCAIALLINQSVDINSRASVNGLTMTLGSLSKAFGPPIGSITYAWSIQHNFPFPLDFHLVFIIVALMSFTCCSLFYMSYRQSIVLCCSPVESIREGIELVTKNEIYSKLPSEETKE